jgi:hypothetical protein
MTARRISSRNTRQNVFTHSAEALGSIYPNFLFEIAPFLNANWALDVYRRASKSAVQAPVNNIVAAYQDIE